MTAIVTEIEEIDWDKPPELAPHYKITIALPGGLLHVASWNLPLVNHDTWLTGMDKITGVDADWILDSDYGEAIGWIDWSAVQAITWRWWQ
jgi:hypothetical protein